MYVGLYLLGFLYKAIVIEVWITSPRHGHVVDGTRVDTLALREDFVET